MPPSQDKKRAVRAHRPGPYPKRGPQKSTKGAPKKAGRTRENLMLQNWLEIFDFIDKHPDMSQSEVVVHFVTRLKSPMIFTQATLSRRIKARPELEARAKTTPTALSGKRERIDTNQCPSRLRVNVALRSSPSSGRESRILTQPIRGTHTLSFRTRMRPGIRKRARSRFFDRKRG